MMVYCDEMDELVIPSNWEAKPFDLKKINDISRNHPYQEFMFIAF